MSWWDTTSSFSNLASQALKNAQKKIDKVLDIDEANKRKSASQQKAKDCKESVKEKKNAESGDFWSSWMGTGSQDGAADSSGQSSVVPSSWSLPWGSGGEEVKSPGGKGAGDSDIPEEESLASLELTSDSESNSTILSLSEPAIPKESIIEPEEEGQWVGDEKSGTSSALVSGESLNNSVPKRQGSVSEKEISKVDDVDQTTENVHHPELEAVSASEMRLSQCDNSHSDVSPVLRSEPDNRKPKHSFDVQEASVSSNSGWDISNSVLELVESSEEKEGKEKDISGVYDLNSVRSDDIIQPDVQDHSSGVDIPLNDNTLCVQSEHFHDENNDNTLHDSSCDESTFLATEKEISATSSLSQVQDDDDESILKKDEVIPSDDVNSETDNKQTTAHSVSDLVSEHVSNLEEVQDRDMLTMHSEESEDSSSTLNQSYVSVSHLSKESFTRQTDEHCLTDSELGTSATSSEFEIAAAPDSSTGSSDTVHLDTSAETLVERTGVDVGRDDHYSLFGESKLGKVEDEKRHSMIGDTVSPDGSFVKCMLEDAMEESGKEDSGSDNHSNGSKSESSKLDSEGDKSGYSGQESSDDIETNTSSDIEIISVSGLGLQDKQFHPGFDLPQLKIAINQRRSGMDRQGYQHFDSQSSSSTQSKVGDHDELSPERGEGHSWRDDDLEAVQEENANNPYHPERLLQKLAEMAEVLQARETKLVSMSKENHRLMEDTSILRSQLQQSEEARETETADLKALTDEFTIRISESEKKLQGAIREKEALKQQLTFTQTELQKRSQNTDLEVLLEEKTEQVQELLAEGEKLSKQQLQSSTIIKKLRAKEKESDATITFQKKKIEDQTTELDRLKVVLDSKEEMESKQADAINQLNAAVKKQEQDYSKTTSDLEDAQEKIRGLQTALDNAYKEMAELHRSNASQDCKAQEAALSKETSLREEMKMTLEREQQRFKREKEGFIMQADDLRLDMTKLEKEHNRREDLLREEIAHLQERLQQDEARSQDVSQSITSATRPLLRQIENLQATHAAQTSSWEKVEKSLTDRLAEMQVSLAMAQEKERTASENEMEMKAKSTSLESVTSRLKQEKAQLLAQKEADQLRLEELQDARNSFIAQLETSKQSLTQELTQLKMEKVQLESKLTMENNKLDNERKKSAALEDQLKTMERERPKSRGTPSPSPSMSVSRQDSLMGSFYERNSPGANLSFGEDFMDSNSDIRSSSKTSVYDNLRQSGATIVMENLQSQLKLREGEINHLQSEIAQLERTRESMARELVNLSNQNDELSEMKKTHEELEEKHKELNNRYSAILLMYGEKEEQVQELRLDLQDVKEMYKTQIDTLLAK